MLTEFHHRLHKKEERNAILNTARLENVQLTEKGGTGQIDRVLGLGRTEHHRVDVRLVVHSSAIDEKLEATAHGDPSEGPIDGIVSVAQTKQFRL